MNLIKRLLGRRKSNEEIALELTDALAEAFSDDPGVEIMPPMTWEETFAYLKSIEIEEAEDEPTTP